MIPLILEFMRPARLGALLLIPAIAGLYWYLASRLPQTRLPDSRLRFVIPKDASWKRHGAVLLALLSMASLIIAWAMPKDYGQQPRDRATIVVTIDVSWSMEAEDVEPTRFEAAKTSAKSFVESLPERFNVSLVSFSGVSSIVVPPTTDRGLVTRAIDKLSLGPSTATGEAVYTSLDAVKLAPPDPDNPDETAPAAIVLLSDGARNIGRDSAEAATISGEMGIPIYTIAYGTQNGYVIDQGQKQRVAVDHHEMYVIAENSGGAKFAAESGSELNKIYQSIASDVGYELIPIEVTDRYAGLAIVFAVLAALGVISLGARWP